MHTPIIETVQEAFRPLAFDVPIQYVSYSLCMVRIYIQTHKKFDIPKLLFILMLRYILLAPIPIFCKQEKMSRSVAANGPFPI